MYRTLKQRYMIFEIKKNKNFMMLLLETNETKPFVNEILEDDIYLGYMIKMEYHKTIDYNESEKNNLFYTFKNIIGTKEFGLIKLTIEINNIKGNVFEIYLSRQYKNEKPVGQTFTNTPIGLIKEKDRILDIYEKKKVLYNYEKETN